VEKTVRQGAPYEAFDSGLNIHEGVDHRLRLRAQLIVLDGLSGVRRCAAHAASRHRSAQIAVAVQHFRKAGSTARLSPARNPLLIAIVAGDVSIATGERLTLRPVRRMKTPSQTDIAMPKPRFHIRHLCRTFYLSEWWDE
jgi:hypothetical protein